MKSRPAFVISVFLILCFSSVAIGAEELTVPDILAKIKSQQSKIKDMQADMTTTITSSLKDGQKIVQKGKMWNKAPDKSRMEIASPMRQITITNGNMMCVINPDTGQKFCQDLSQISSPGSPGPSQQMDPTEALKYFDLKLTQHGTQEYIISGTPKEENEFLGRMDFFIDAQRWVPLRIAIYSVKGKLVSLSEVEYKKISDCWVASKNSSTVTLPSGRMDVEMVFSNIKVNKGIKDEVFEIE